jgi:hypothetical protein
VVIVVRQPTVSATIAENPHSGFPAATIGQIISACAAVLASRARAATTNFIHMAIKLGLPTTAHEAGADHP